MKNTKLSTSCDLLNTSMIGNLMSDDRYLRRIKELKKNPSSVFISYAWETEEHLTWAKALAINLRHNGCEVLFDQFEQRKNPADLAIGGLLCNTIVIIMSPAYYHRSFAGTELGFYNDGWVFDEFQHIVANFQQLNRVVTAYRFGNRCFYDFPIIDFSNKDKYHEALRSLLVFIRLSASSNLQIPKLLLNPVFYFVEDNDGKTLIARNTPLQSYPYKNELRKVVFTKSRNRDDFDKYVVGGREI